MNQRTNKFRRGVSLTELVLLMSSYSMILTVCSVLLHRVMHVQIESRSFVDAERNSERLGDQFRQDVHQATTADVNGTKLENGVFLQLQLLHNQRIEYSRVKGNVLRTAMHADKIGAREEFAFEPSCKLVIRQDESPKRIVLSITSAALDPMSDKAEQLQSYKAVPVGLHVEANLGRDVTSIGSTGGPERAK